MVRFLTWASWLETISNCKFLATLLFFAQFSVAAIFLSWPQKDWFHQHNQHKYLGNLGVKHQSLITGLFSISLPSVSRTQTWITRDFSWWEFSWCWTSFIGNCLLVEKVPLALKKCSISSPLVAHPCTPPVASVCVNVYYNDTYIASIVLPWCIFVYRTITWAPILNIGELPGHQPGNCPAVRPHTKGTFFLRYLSSARWIRYISMAFPWWLTESFRDSGYWTLPKDQTCHLLHLLEILAPSNAAIW